MKISRRTVLIIAFSLGLFLLVGFSFPSFVQDNFITPIALVLWLGWRVLRSIDQQIYWFVLIFAVVSYCLIRLFRWVQGAETVEQTQALHTNAALEQISYWRALIHFTGFKIDPSNNLERSLAKMLAALYASKQIHVVPHETYGALERRQIPMPEPVYAFLFPAQSFGAKRSIKQVLRNLRDIPRNRIRRWTGREKAEYYQLLDQVLQFMESIMENEHDDKHLDAHHD